MVWLIVALVSVLLVSGVSNKVLHNRLKQKEEQIEQLRREVEEYSRQLALCQKQVQKSKAYCDKRAKNYQRTTQRLIELKKLLERSHEEGNNDAILNELNRMFSG